jgi:hypothetical protein
MANVAAEFKFFHNARQSLAIHAFVKRNSRLLVAINSLFYLSDACIFIFYKNNTQKRRKIVA